VNNTRNSGESRNSNNARNPQDEASWVGSEGEGGRFPVFIPVPRGLERLLRDEMLELGLPEGNAIHLGVQAQLTTEECWRLVYGSRLASRVVRPLAVFDCRDADELYDRAVRMDWLSLIGVERTFAIGVSVRDSSMTHSQYAALRFKDAVVDHIRDRHPRRERPSVDRDNPDIMLDLHIRRDVGRIGLNYSAGTLHRRGYRVAMTEAPLKENLAAGILRMAEWGTGSAAQDVAPAGTPAPSLTPLVDLFCGSGTFLCEAAMIARRMPAGLLRPRQGFEALPDFDRRRWEALRVQMDSQIRALPDGLLIGRDLDRRALGAAWENLSQLGVEEQVWLEEGSFDAPGLPHEFIAVGNPPYGVRLGEEAEAEAIYRTLGEWLPCTGASRALLLVPPGMGDCIGLRPYKVREVDNGSLELFAAEYRFSKRHRPSA
jgi:putative N6-adenine-specific DNA methylase